MGVCNFVELFAIVRFSRRLRTFQHRLVMCEFFQGLYTAFRFRSTYFEFHEAFDLACLVHVLLS